MRGSLSCHYIIGWVGTDALRVSNTLDTPHKMYLLIAHVNVIFKLCTVHSLLLTLLEWTEVAACRVQLILQTATHQGVNILCGGAPHGCMCKRKS